MAVDLHYTMQNQDIFELIHSFVYAAKPQDQNTMIPRPNNERFGLFTR